MALFNLTGFGRLFIYQLETQTVHLKVPPPPKLNTMSPFKVAQCTVCSVQCTLWNLHTNPAWNETIHSRSRQFHPVRPLIPYNGVAFRNIYVLLNLVCIHYSARDCLIKSAAAPLMVTVCVLKSPRGATAFLLLARNPGSSEMEESFFKESTNTMHGKYCKYGSS